MKYASLSFANKNRIVTRVALFCLVLFLIAMPIFASTGSESHGAFSMTFLWIAIIILAAKISSLIERFGQPSVLGELVIGVILGNLILLGFYGFESLKEDGIIKFLAELGVIVLLFQVGLESNVDRMRKVGIRAFLVACVGVVVPFVLGTWIVGPWLLPGLSFNTYLFVGAILTATSVGITARVFKDLNKLRTPEAQIVLGAAVIDDVVGLIILAAISAIVTLGTVSVGAIALIAAKALIFLAGAIFIGQLAAQYVGKFFAKIHTGVGMKFTLAISFGLILSYAAGELGLAPIVGAFAAGLVLDPVHFKYFRDPHIVEELRETIKNTDEETKGKIKKVISHHSNRHIEDIIEPIGMFLAPIFFVMTGMAVKLDVLFDLRVLGTALVITVIAFAGKIVAGSVAGKVNKWVVGWGMVPRGEVGLIFAAIGKELGVVNDQVFSIIVIVVILSTLLIPPVLTMLLKRQSKMATA